jgi:hypothetical protein
VREKRFTMMKEIPKTTGAIQANASVVPLSCERKSVAGALYFGHLRVHKFRIGRQYIQISSEVYRNSYLGRRKEFHAKAQSADAKAQR